MEGLLTLTKYALFSVSFPVADNDSRNALWIEMSFSWPLQNIPVRQLSLFRAFCAVLIGTLVFLVLINLLY